MSVRLGLVPLLLCAAEAVSAQVVQTEDGLVQVAGLTHRSPQEIERLIQEESPGTNLSSGACAAVLKHMLGFPDAAVIRYSTDVLSGHDSLREPPFTMLLLVEPEDADRVRYLPAPPDSSGPVREWAEQYALYPMGRLSSAIRKHVGRPDGKPVILREGMPDTVRVLMDVGVRFLESHDREEDRQRALEVIRTDRDWINRSIASAILTNFPEEDSTWWALASAIRGIGPHDYGRDEAIMAIQALDSAHPRPVDWAPAAETLHVILQGTNLFAVAPLMQALTMTKISPVLADEVIGDGRFILAYLRSPNQRARTRALQFLRQISGQDFGEDLDRWQEWIESLS